jgi:hypothetical protein
MKKASGTIIVLAVLITATALFAGSSQRLRVAIPFDFYVQDRLLPAGDYIFEMRPASSYASSASSIAILSKSGKMEAFILTNSGSSNLSDQHLHFQRYGYRVYLSSIDNMGLQARVAPSRGERILRAQIKSADLKLAANK